MTRDRAAYFNRATPADSVPIHSTSSGVLTMADEVLLMSGNGELLVRNCFPVLCVMHARACLDVVGRFDETMTTHEDWEMWVRLSARFPFTHLKTITCEFSHGSRITRAMAGRPRHLRRPRLCGWCPNRRFQAT